MAEQTWQEITAENEKETRRLEGLIKKLTDRELSLPMEAGWTVASVLAHMAFWDIRAARLIDLWKQKGVEYSPLDADLVNKVNREIFLALPPRAAAELALDKARSIDRLLTNLDPAFIEKVRTIGQNVRLERFNHRRLHLDEIEKKLKMK